MTPQNPKKLFWAAEQYSHTLIATPNEVTPTGGQVKEFLSRVIAQEVVPGPHTIRVRALTGKTREFPVPDPFTGEKLKVEVKDQRKLLSVEDIGGAVEALRDYEVEVSGT